MRNDLKITTAITAALLAGACQREADQWTTDRDTAICTDRSGQRVADSNCPRGAYAGGSHGGGVSPFLWYYLGRSSVVPYYGERVAGGSYSRASGRSYAAAPVGSAVTRAGAISRGGFGSSAHGFGGGGE